MGEGKDAFSSYRFGGLISSYVEEMYECRDREKGQLLVKDYGEEKYIWSALPALAKHLTPKEFMVHWDISQ